MGYQPGAPRKYVDETGFGYGLDFAESNVFSESSGNYEGGIDSITSLLSELVVATNGYARQLDATAAVNGDAAPLVATDPPYYDNIGYADLSDFFYVWLRRSVGRIYPQLFSTLLVPKAQELIATPYRFEGNKEKAQKFFEEGLGKAFVRMREAHNAAYPLIVFYAFKQAEEEESQDDGDDSQPALVSTGWETMLEGVIRAGFQITGTWPMRTELARRMVGRAANALASSVVLACRGRPDDAPLATRRQFVDELRANLPAALKTLQHGSIAPVDLAQAAIGPGMAIFSRYSKVLETDGSPMRVRTALGLTNQALDEILAEQEGEYDAETRWALAWFEQNGMNEGKFGDADTLSRAKDTAVNALQEAGIVNAGAGKVHLVQRDVLSPDWDPAAETRLTVWELASDPRAGNRRRRGCSAHNPASRCTGGDRQGPRLPPVYNLRPQGPVPGGARLQHVGQVLAGAAEAGDGQGRANRGIRPFRALNRWNHKDRPFIRRAVVWFPPHGVVSRTCTVSRPTGAGCVSWLMKRRVICSL